MAEIDQEKRPIVALVIDTGHEYQRDQDEIEEREKVRADLEHLIRKVIADRSRDTKSEIANGTRELLRCVTL